ncbi:unnamed protein product [Ilex paraguariensis]|uniref:C2H2-type domain-containing protein n=1 Tax=Ilex paraguariensis TaxID=185542 RepID=A0ABC8R3Y5_9AQUA
MGLIHVVVLVVVEAEAKVEVVLMSYGRSFSILVVFGGVGGRCTIATGVHSCGGSGWVWRCWVDLGVGVGRGTRGDGQQEQKLIQSSAVAACIGFQSTHALKVRTGHENHGVYICHKCGWPFPNLHPSSRHRRAHKKICGTIEGYKLNDLEDHTHTAVSDDEHVSDEDGRTPSPKIEKKSAKGFGSGGVGEKSNRSEDEVFSDAVAEFTDSGFSPGIEGRVESTRELNKNVEKVVEVDKENSQSLQVEATAVEKSDKIWKDHGLGYLGLAFPNGKLEKFE